MAGDIFSYILLAGIVCGGIWGIMIKVREFSSFIKKNGWQPIRKKTHDFFIKILRITIYTLIGIGYLSIPVLIPLRFDWVLENEDYINVLIFSYLFLGLLALYYINGIKRRNTKNLITMFLQDFIDFKNGIKEFLHGFIQGGWILTKILLVLAGWLLAIAAGIGVIALCIWLIVALGPLWIITIILLLILLILFVIVNK